MRDLHRFLMSTVAFHGALLPPTVRYLDEMSSLSDMWLACNAPVVIGFRAGAWG